MNKIIQELEKKEKIIQDQLELLMHDLQFILKSKEKLITKHVDQYDMKKYMPYYPKYHGISELENTYESHRVDFLNLCDPFTEKDDDEYMDVLETMNSNLKKKRNLIDILNKKLIAIKAWFDAMEYVKGLQGPTIKQLITVQIMKKSYSSNTNVYIYNVTKKNAFKQLVSLI